MAAARRRKPAAVAWPVEWFRLRIGPSEWRVVLSLPSSSPQLDGAEGATEFQTSTIWLNAALPADRLPDVYVHELLHAVSFITGASRVLGWSDETEEKLVTMLAPSLTGALLEHAQLPALPALPVPS